MKTITGTILSLNVSPKGFHESFLLKSAKETVQINLPRHSGPEASQGLRTGAKITVEAEELEDERPRTHPVYEWGGEIAVARQGIVKQINYARHGEPNGAILGTGEFLHLRPEGAKAADLALGKKVVFQGEAHTSPAGQTVIEAAVVNGIKMPGAKGKIKEGKTKQANKRS